jgi:signal recognition particle subunit SRP68
MSCERAWAYAMQLKFEMNTEPRKKYHMINRLKKAAQNAAKLDSLCNESAVVDARCRSL